MATRDPKALTRLAQLRDASPYTEASWPGRPELKLKLRALSCSEVLDCRAAAEAELARRGLKDALFNADAKEEEIATQILFLACRDIADVKKTFAADIEDLRENMTPDERAALFVLWNEHRESVDPDPDTMDAGTLAAVIDALKKKDRRALKSLGSAALASSLLTMASQLALSPTGKSESS